MIVFLTLLQKLIPLYGLIGLGFIAGKKLKIDRETLGTLLLYIIGPAVFFYSTASLTFTPKLLVVPVLVYLCACSLSVLNYFFTKGLWSQKTSLRNIAAFSAGTGNTGYFGIPVVLMLFGETAVGYAVIFIIGTVLFENTLGFYFAARGSFDARQSIRKLLRLPSVYAFILGLTFSAYQLEFSGEVRNVFLNIRGAYSFIGMILIGLALSAGRFESDSRFLWTTFITKFIGWPLIMGSLAWMDNKFWHFLPTQVHQVVLVLACVPLAANTVVIATLLKTEPQIVSFAVLVSTLVALVTIPLVVSFAFSGLLG